jgi:hypothetical protein
MFRMRGNASFSPGLVQRFSNNISSLSVFIPFIHLEGSSYGWGEPRQPSFPSFSFFLFLLFPASFLRLPSRCHNNVEKL